MRQGFVTPPVVAMQPVGRPSARQVGLKAVLGVLLALVLGTLLSPVWAAPVMDRLMPIGLAEAPPSLDPFDPAWTGAAAVTVALYPQATAPDGPDGGILTLEARLLRGDGKLAVRLSWPDANPDLPDTQATHRFADAAAVQFAPAGGTLPYVGMGEPGRPVRVWFWRAGGPGEGLIAQGFGTLSQDAGPPPEAHALRTATGWAVVLRGELGPDVSALAFAAWDGAEDGRAGRKRLSAWRWLERPGIEPSADWAEEARATGDPVQGQRLYARHGCNACHAQGAGLAPDLSHAGGIHWPGYLRRAIREPAGFLVPGFTAVMPTLPLSPAETEDLVAYLTTLR